MQVVIRTDASSRIGSGHVMRCLTLADCLVRDGAEVTFVCREHDGNLIDLIERKGFALARLPRPTPDGGLTDYAAWLGVSQAEDAAQTAQAMGGSHADWIVVDHYGLDAEWEATMRPHASRLLVVDDLANRRHDCDALLDQNLVASFEHRYDTLLDSGAVRLLGPHYALLQPEYAALAVAHAAATAANPRILIFMGGADRGTTLKAVKGLLALGRRDLTCDIVMANTNPDSTEVRRLIADHPNMEIHDFLPSLAPLMARASLAVGAGGATSWERLCLGLRAVVIILADNQRAITDELERRGLVTVAGEAASVTAEDFRRAIDTELRNHPARVPAAAIDGRGAERVAAILTVNADTPLVMRPVAAADEAMLLDWANDTLVRSNAFNPEPIAPDGHHRWLSARLSDQAHCRFLIAETRSGVPLGQVRFDRRDDVWVIDYSVAPHYRGRGLGRPILQAAIRQMQPGERLVGEVLAKNLASHKVFRSLGFHSMPGQHGATRYEIQL